MATSSDDTDTDPSGPAPAGPEGFAELGLRPELLTALQELGYEEPTPVQRAALPPMLQGRDVLGQAATGTGKTAAFALPLLERMEPGQSKPFETSALVVVPTRELAMQVAEAVHAYGRKLGVTVLPVYGGQDIGQQLRKLKRGVDVVIATPGRALDHVRRKTLKLEKVRTVVLDEADEMLDLGFAEELDQLLSELPEERQTALFSATLPPRIAAIAERHLRKPVRLKIEAAQATPRSLPKIRQTAYVVPPSLKELALGRVLDVEAPTSAIIFCRTRLEVDKLTETLGGHGYGAAALHGGMTQEQRERVLKQFKGHKLELLVATDVAARGLDVEKLSHVINYDLPTAPEAYVHRIGRTGRAGREGVAITLLEPREHRFLRNIERLTGQKVEVGQLPTVVDLRNRRLELTRATVEEALGSEGLDPFRALVEQLASSAEVMEVAAAAVSALHHAMNPPSDEDETEIPRWEVRAPPASRGREGRGPSAGSHSVAARGGGDREERGPRSPRAPRPDGARPEGARPPRGPRSGAAPVRLFVGLGRSAGLRPADLVGAIANEAGVKPSDIGAIQIFDRHAFVEVAEDRAADVVEALQGSTLRGRKFRIDHDRRGDPGGPPKGRTPRE